MNIGQRETIMTRVISTSFVVVALAIFKPFGLEAWQWQAYVHLAMIFVLGIIVCMITDAVMKYVVRMPLTYDKGVGYIIRRNLWFQLINTPFVALMICLYRHFVLSQRVESNKLSWINFMETLAIIAFCSFAIGLYWRFKYRSRFLAAELEETRLLNEQLMQTRHPDGDTKAAVITLTGTTNESVTLQITDLLYIEAVGNYVKVCRFIDGKVRTDMLRATSKQMENDLSGFPTIVRCHRAFLVNLTQVEQIVSNASTMQLLICHCHVSIPVSRSHVTEVKQAIKGIR